MDRTQLLLALSVALFAIGLTGVMIRRNALVMLMCMELMMNGVNLTLVSFAQQTPLHGEGLLIVFSRPGIVVPDHPDDALLKDRGRYHRVFRPKHLALLFQRYIQ